MGQPALCGVFALSTGSGLGPRLHVGDRSLQSPFVSAVPRASGVGPDAGLLKNVASFFSLKEKKKRLFSSGLSAVATWLDSGLHMPGRDMQG